MDGPRGHRHRELVQHAAVGDDHALGAARGARGVEQGHRVIRRDLPIRSVTADRRRGEPVPAQRLEVLPGDVAVVGRAGFRVPHDDLHEAGQPVQRRLQPGQFGDPVDDGDAGVAVGGHEGDLVGGQRGVERHRDATGVHGRQVREHVLDPVGHQQRHPLTGLQAQLDQAGRQFHRPPPGLRPGQRLPLGARGVAVGVGRHLTGLLRHVPQLIAKRPARDALLQLRPVPQNLRGQRVPPDRPPALPFTSPRADNVLRVARGRDPGPA